MGKRIIGYAIKENCKQFKRAAKQITDNSSLFEHTRESCGYDFEKKSEVKNQLEKAGVLDLWFDPVYGEEFKFETGKWYNITNPEGNYYIKVGEVDSYDLSHCNFITATGFHNLGGFSIDRITKSKLLTDLSEIQEYLPKNHPDKNPVFKIGSWYKTILGSLVKFKKIRDDGIFIASEYILYNSDKLQGESIFGPASQTFIEVSLEEIQQYLPAGHPDKKPIFEIGKWYEVHCFYNNYIIKYGEDLRNLNNIENKHYYSNGSFDSRMEFLRELKVEDEEIQEYLPYEHIDKIKPNFKVGDFVCETWSSSPDTKKAYKVTKVKGKDVYYDRYDTCYSNEKDLTFAAPKEIDEYTNNFLVGEAKKRYPVGCRINRIGLNVGGDFDNECRFSKYQIYNLADGTQLYVDGGLLLYDRGIWAEVIKDVNSNISINGYDCKIYSTYVKFGCEPITAEFILKVNYLQSLGVDFTQESSKIKKLAEYFNKK